MKYVVKHTSAESYFGISNSNWPNWVIRVQDAVHYPTLQSALEALQLAVKATGITFPVVVNGVKEVVVVPKYEEVAL